ncbi:hypothetical protein AB0L40_25610 [Patulibacter sp. NPDC049589]|uniref:hypothetical protein n=1 Tax=Patulibacter sp. NPDC049589 TaxID=3154731 RepID=UPI00343F0660
MIVDVDSLIFVVSGTDWPSASRAVAIETAPTVWFWSSTIFADPPASLTSFWPFARSRGIEIDRSDLGLLRLQATEDPIGNARVSRSTSSETSG